MKFRQNFRSSSRPAPVSAAKLPAGSIDKKFAFVIFDAELIA